MFWDKWFNKSTPVNFIKEEYDEEGVHVVDPSVDPLHTYKVAFNKLGRDEKTVYGFAIEFLSLFSPVGEETKDADFHIDFVNDEDVDYLIEALEELKMEKMGLEEEVEDEEV